MSKDLSEASSPVEKGALHISLVVLDQWQCKLPAFAVHKEVIIIITNTVEEGTHRKAGRHISMQNVQRKGGDNISYTQ